MEVDPASIPYGPRAFDVTDAARWSGVRGGDGWGGWAGASPSGTGPGPASPGGAGDAGPGEGERAGLDPLSVLEPFEPPGRDGVGTEVRPGQGPEDRAGGVGVAPEVDDLDQGLFEAVGREQEAEAGGDAGGREAHGGPL